jgi:hypothetical protein
MEKHPTIALGIDLQVTRTEEGGRKELLDGSFTTKDIQYRPNWGFAGLDHPQEQTGAPVFAWSQDRIAPGDHVRAVIVPMYPQHWEGVDLGAQLTMYEGHRICGLATVVRRFVTRFPIPDVDIQGFQTWTKEAPTSPNP